MKIKDTLFVSLLFLSSVLFAQTGTTYSVTVTSGGSARTFEYYVPTAYDPSTDTIPLVINVHGFTGSSSAQDIAEDFRKIADTAKFIIMLPQALGNPGFSNITNNPTSWNVWNTVEDGAADRTFIMAALDTVQAHYNINKNRIYITGFSQGAYMSYIISTIFSGRIAAMASVSGTMATDYIKRCFPVHPLPVMEIHGTHDQLVSYNGTSNGLPVDTVVNHWIKFNHCHSTPDSTIHLPDFVDSATVDSSKVIHYVYKGGDKGVSVEFYKILGGGHEVPSSPPVPTGYGIGNINEDFTAAKVIWRFFNQYRLNNLYTGPADSSHVLPPSSPSPTGVTDISVDKNIVSIYPNPSNGTFTLTVENNTNTSIKITDVLGNIVFETSITKQSTTINLNASGVYFYQVKNETLLISTGKLIVN